MVGRPAPRSMRRRERLGEQLDAGRGGDPARGTQARLRGSAPWPSSSTTGSPPRMTSAISATRSSLDGLCGRPARRARRPRRPRTTTRRPAARGSRCWPGGCMAAAIASAASAPTSSGAFERAGPAAEPAGERVDVGLERRVVPLVVRGVVADHVDDRGVRAARVVQVREAVARPGPRCSSVAAGLSAMRAVAVGRAGHDALEQRQHARASPARRRARRRSASRRCPGWRSRRRRPPSTSVRRSAWAPFISAMFARSQLEKSTPGLRMPFGSNACLIRRISSIFAGSSSSRK